MRRSIFTEDHETFAETVREFIARQVAPHYERWEIEHRIDRSLFTEAGKYGLIGFQVPEEHGGPGEADFRFNAVVGEEFARAGYGSAGLALGLQTDVVLPYLLHLGTAEQQARWLPDVVTGQTILALAMTEPGAGSDLTGIRTRAVRNGDHYVVDGAKTFISNGQNADLVVVAVRTSDHPHKGLTLLVLERGMPGFTRGRNLDKIGMHAQDTSELAFDSVRVPVANRLGDEGGGFYGLVRSLPQERLNIAISAVAAAEGTLGRTLAYVQQRHAFGQPIGSFQHNKFLLAELSTEVGIARVYLDACLAAHCAGELSADDAARAKWWTTELQCTVADRCLQLHGGYGYMREYPVARAFTDARVQTIYGGTTEIMKEIIGRNLGL